MNNLFFYLKFTWNYAELAWHGVRGLSPNTPGLHATLSNADNRAADLPTNQQVCLNELTESRGESPADPAHSAMCVWQRQRWRKVKGNPRRPRGQVRVDEARPKAENGANTRDPPKQRRKAPGSPVQRGTRGRRKDRERHAGKEKRGRPRTGRQVPAEGRKKRIGDGKGLLVWEQLSIQGQFLPISAPQGAWTAG